MKPSFSLQLIIGSLGSILLLLSVISLWLDYQILEELPLSVNAQGWVAVAIIHGISFMILTGIYVYFLWQWQQRQKDMATTIPAPPPGTSPETVENPLSQGQFSAALHDSPIFGFTQDLHLNYTWVENPPANWANRPILGQLDSDLWCPEDAQALTELKQKVLQTGVGIRQSQKLMIADESRYFDLSVQPLRNGVGEVVGVAGLAMDITPFQEREEQLQSIFEAVMDAITILDETGTYIKVNRAASALFGVPASELIGRRLGDFTVSDFDLPSVWHCFQTTGEAAGECEILRPDGEIRTVEFAATAHIFPGQHLSVVRDITERKQAELALRQSEERFRRFFEEAPIGIATVNLETYQFMRVNRVFREMLGYSEVEFMDLTLKDVTHPDDLDTDLQLSDQVYQGEVPSYQLEKRYIKKNGEQVWVHFTATFLCDQKGSPCYSLGMVEDITDRKQAEEMRQALAAEKELRNLQLRFFAMASHEFRTPLSTILVTVQLLKAYTDEWPAEKRIRNLQRIEKTAKNMTQLLDDILTLNRAETGKLDLKPCPIQLHSFCQSILDEMKLIAKSTHHFQLTSQNPSLELIMDEMILRKILTNLLTNAIKYSPAGGIISLTVMNEGDQITLQIQDQGIGISREHQRYLFEPFHRGQNIGNIPGTGLGLAVVKRCLDAQGGTIDIVSQENLGTTVTVTLKV